jgi:hypothetical protein
VAIDISLEKVEEFASLLEAIRKAYSSAVQAVGRPDLSDHSLYNGGEREDYYSYIKRSRDIRLNRIKPALTRGENQVVLDFANVTGATQSFIHALISEVIREYGDEIFERLYFKNCSPTVRQVVNIVADYMEDSSANFT